jgi:hypothetical protein
MTGANTPILANSLPVAMAALLGACIPLWVFIAWMASSSVLWRWVAERSWWRWVAVLVGVAALICQVFGFGWAYHTLLGSTQTAERQIVDAAWMGQLGLCLVVMLWIGWRRRRVSVPPPRPVQHRPNPTPIMLVLVGWVVLALGFAFLKFGPLATEPASPRDRSLLAVAGAVIAILMVMWVSTIRARRNGTGTTGGGGI